MNLKKMLLSVITITMFLSFVFVQGAAYATTLPAGQEVYMGVTELMRDNSPNMGYSINLPGTANAAKLWNIVKYKASDSQSFDEANIYCVKAGVGFTEVENGGLKKAPYNVFYDMKTEKESIAAQNAILKDLVEKTITEGSKTYSRYNALLAVLDMLYLPGESTSAEKTDLINTIINYAKQPENRFTNYVELMQSYPLTDNDISAVQQAVIWYFTNYGEENSKYDKTGSTAWLYYTLDGASYDNLANYTPNSLQPQYDAGQARSYQAEILYNYMINQAKERASSTNTTSTGEPVIVDTKTLQVTESGNVGPIHLTEVYSTPYTIDFVVGDGNVNYKLLDENENEVSSGTTVKDLVGKDFYISVPQDELDGLSIKIKVNYTNKTMKLWASTTNNQEQPLVEVNQTNPSKEVPLVLVQDKPLDLALRKYITEINGVKLEDLNLASRVPNIDSSKLNTLDESGNQITTAKYMHRKDPVTVVTGSKVTYKLTIYNEGKKAGRATEVIDQLPTGLKFTKVVSGNFELSSYDEENNTVNLVRKADNTDNLPAYTTGNPSSETIEIECEVIAKPHTQNEKVLTNVAWISKAIDEDGIVITNQAGVDRDSEPSTHPTVNKDSMSDYKGNGNKEQLNDSTYYYKGQQDDDDFEKLVILPEAFDLALRKYITEINGVKLEDLDLVSRVPNIDTSKLNKIDEESGELITTAEYNHKKDPVTIVTGDKVTYELTIYNEGEKAGRATEVIDQLPTGLKFTKVVSGNFELSSYDEENNTVNLIRKADNTDNLPAYTTGNLESETIEIECEVTAKPHTENTKILTNVAWISKAIDEDGTVITNQTGADRDSEPSTHPDVNKDNMSGYTGKNQHDDLSNKDYYYEGKQDDDDFEKLVMYPETFDLKLIKRITAVNGDSVPERIKDVDVSKLNTLDENGKMITTGIYDLDKTAVTVMTGDIVTYTFRIYNEGTIDGYAQEITEDVPKGLQFLWSEKEGEELKQDETLTAEEKEAIEFNQKYLWGNFKYDEAKENIIEISSDYLSKENETTVGGNLIPAFGRNDGTKTEDDISYKEISVKFKVISEDFSGTAIRNEAAITEDCDKNGDPVDDRDSDTEDWVKYEDDEDYDNIILQSFDLALRKFIIAVSNDTKIENSEYLKNENGSYKRAPVVDTSKLNTMGEDGKLITTAIYNHTKEPVLVKQNDIVVYMLRVYNEGDIDGYASEIKDHLPEYLEFVDDEFNKQYGWEVSEDGRTVTTRHLEKEKINKVQINDEQKIVLSYKEVPIMCKVNEKAKTSENITNIADITEYLDGNKKPVTDRDSQEDNVKLPDDKDLPGYKDDEKGSYVPGQQDDDDFEKVIVKIFDLALRKWVTEAIVIENGQQTVTQTGHQPYDDPEQVVKVELHRKKLNQVTVKFRYSIRIINEGEIEGYAKEITDYVPAGLKFVAEDNPGWTDEGNNVISTRLLENTLLKPGEYADVEVLLTWENNENNMGVMVNTAEISEDYNEYDVPDIDSTPDNKKEGEDDIDDAPVMLSITTGQVRIYFTLGFIILITIAGGVILIKKYVL